MKNVFSKVLFVLGICLFVFCESKVVCHAATGPSNVAVKYTTHCQDIGWMSQKANGAVSGTTGRSLRMEAIKLNLSGVSGGIKYQTHCENIGWTSWKYNGAISGTTGRSLRMEAIKICLTGYASQIYDVQYRTHVQNIGWTSWVKNGAVSGTTGRSLRIEAIQVKLTLKDRPTISKTQLKYSMKSTNHAAYSRLYYMIDITGNMYLVTVSFDKNGKVVSYAPWLMPIDLPGES